MAQQVITISPAGIMSGLQRKPGQGVDLRKFGPVEITRASLIEWRPSQQRWWVEVLQDAGKGKVTLQKFVDAVGHDTESTAMLDRLAKKGWTTAHEGVLYFDDYDDAVKVEIAYLDALRLAGKH